MATSFETEGDGWKAREERGKALGRAFLNMKGVEEEEGNRVSIFRRSPTLNQSQPRDLPAHLLSTNNFNGFHADFERNVTRLSEILY